MWLLQKYECFIYLLVAITGSKAIGELDLVTWAQLYLRVEPWHDPT